MTCSDADQELFCPEITTPRERVHFDIRYTYTRQTPLGRRKGHGPGAPHRCDHLETGMKFSSALLSLSSAHPPNSAQHDEVISRPGLGSLRC